MQTEEGSVYFNKATGEVIPISNEVLSNVEEEDEATDLDEDLHDWQKEEMALARQILETDNFVKLPSKFDIHEWEIMNEFAHNIEDEKISKEILDAIHGSGAFRMFRYVTNQYNLRERWFSYRGQVFRKIAIEWCEKNGIDYDE